MLMRTAIRVFGKEVQDVTSAKITGNGQRTDQKKIRGTLIIPSGN